MPLTKLVAADFVLQSPIPYVTPLLIPQGDPILEFAAQGKTTIVLPLKPGVTSSLKMELLALIENSFFTLFLKKLKTISLNITGYPTKVWNRELIPVLEDHPTLSIERDEDTGFVLVSKAYDISSINEPTRANTRETRITLALPFDNPTRTKVLKHGVLHSYLPTGTNPKLPFIINADFILPSTREALNEHNPWNQAIIKQIHELYLAAVVELRNVYSDPKSWASVMQSMPDDSPAPSFGTHLKRKPPSSVPDLALPASISISNIGPRIVAKLRQSLVVLDASEKFQVPYNVTEASAKIYDLIGEGVADGTLTFYSGGAGNSERQRFVHRELSDRAPSAVFRALGVNSFIDSHWNSLAGKSDLAAYFRQISSKWFPNKKFDWIRSLLSWYEKT